MSDRPRGGRQPIPEPAPMTFRPSDEELDAWLAGVDELLEDMDQA